jgi:hypothetical protein
VKTTADYAHSILCLAVDNAEGKVIYQRHELGEKAEKPPSEAERRRASELVVGVCDQINDVLTAILLTDTDTFERFRGDLRSCVERWLLPPLQQQIKEPPASLSATPPPPPADPFAGLRQFARNELKGQERAVIETLCDAGGELPITDLAVKEFVQWNEEFEGFKNAQKRLNPKLKRIGWTVARQSNAAKLIRIRG